MMTGIISWNEVMQKQHIVGTILQNGLINKKVSHAYLFNGEAGTLKKETALLFIKTLFCLENSQQMPCDKCGNCNRINNNIHPDVVIISPEEGGSIKKEQIQQLHKEISYTSTELSKKIYLIDRVEMLTTSAANSLLKFLEEPDGNTTAILVTENIQKVLSTIQSRCQILNFLVSPMKEYEEELAAVNLSKDIVKLLTRMTNNIEKAESLANEQWFIDLYLQIVSLMKNLMEPAVFIEIIKLLKLIDTKEKEPILFKFINIWFKDVLYALTNKKDFISFQSQINILELHAEKLGVKGIADAIELLEKCYTRRQANVSLNLVLQEMFIKLQKNVYIVAL
ncbi:DNA polymerase III subunit delta' [Bacillus mycoides]|nr:DNA polymerase III subunit delta' [Bacillus mycoides]OFD45072.1 DNA polymerase III subunit delta' [Bacillus mycoides]OFD57950.1 DNA polymerase III subunit delta' [Bacillus mycoides]